MSQNIIELFARRRSIRQFTGEPVAREKLRIALQAAMAAPSANNGRPWHFIVVTTPDTIRSLCAQHPYAGFGAKAGAVILPFGKKANEKWFDQDLAAATENLLVALASMDLGATWCGMDDVKQHVIQSLVGLPDEQYVFALIPVGVPAETKEPRTQFEESRVHWERYTGT